MKSFSLVLFLFVALAALATGRVSSVNAQTAEPTALKNVHLWVNPEYDDPRLLVMLEGQIVGAQLPTMVRFIVPTTAEMYSAGSKNSFGEYTGGPPERKASSINGWDEISYQLTENTFRVEYYNAIGQTLDKSFAYEFLRLYPVQDLTLIVQEPKNSTTFTATPQGKSSTDTEGFKIQSTTYSNLETATPVKFDISYTRTTSQPSLSTSPSGSGAPGSTSNTGLIIGVVMVAVVLGGGGLYLMSRSNRRSGPVSRAARRRGAVGNKVAARSSAAAFCGQCGTKLDKPTRFCPDCGAEL